MHAQSCAVADELTQPALQMHWPVAHWQLPLVVLHAGHAVAELTQLQDAVYRFAGAVALHAHAPVVKLHAPLTVLQPLSQ